MPEASLTNLIAWATQVFVIAALAWLLPILFRVRHPRTQLVYCHAVLALCLILPLIEPRRHPVIHIAAGATRTSVTPSIVQIILWTLAAGATLRLLWLLAGLWEIRRYRIGALPLYPIPESVRAAAAVTHTDAVLCISPHVTGPVMLGWLTPVVLLPESFLSLDEEAQCAIVCHELLHVRRHDWLVTLFEELAGAFFWFNPAVWAVLAQTRLAREELVDAEVVHLTAARDPYIDALLAIARGQSVSDLAPAPAPLFLRRRHLTQRMHSLLKEIPMSNSRLMSSYGSIAVMLALATWFTVGTFPLVGQPQVVADVSTVATQQSLHVAPAAAPVAPRTLRADVHIDPRRPAGIALQSRQIMHEQFQSSGPLPADPRELAIGLIQPASSPLDRANAVELIGRAEERAKFRVAPYKLSVSFVASGDVQYLGSGELTETWFSARDWRWTASLAGYSIERVGSGGVTADVHRVSMIPMRVQMLRNAIFWTEYRPAPNAIIRSAQSLWNGKPVTCVLSSNVPPRTSSTRHWEEQERCIDNETALIQVLSVAPGASVIYGYTRSQQFHRRTVPDRITIYINGNVVLDAQMSITDLGLVDQSLFTITPEMGATGPPIMLMSVTRFPHEVGDAAGANRPVIVHATIDGKGNAIEVELCSASDPGLAQQAIDLVKKTSFSPSGASQRDSYINVKFGAN